MSFRKFRKAQKHFAEPPQSPNSPKIARSFLLQCITCQLDIKTSDKKAVQANRE
jgi:hypothetical protein